MAYRLDIGLWNQVFAVPCGLVDRHLKLAGKEELQVILYLLRHPGEALEPQALGDALGMPLEKAQEALKNAEIQSSIDGTVVRVNSRVGQFADKVENDQPILSIENLEELEMEIKISEYSIGKVKVGQKVMSFTISRKSRK